MVPRSSLSAVTQTKIPLPIGNITSITHSAGSAYAYSNAGISARVTYKLLDISTYVEVYEIVGLQIVQFNCQFRPFMRYLHKAYVILFREGGLCVFISPRNHFISVTD